MIFFFTLAAYPQDEYLKIDTSVSPSSISRGEEGVLKIKITPRSDIKIPSISSHLGFMIKFEDDANLSFPKVFYTASELDLQMKQENDSVYLDFEKEIPITFKVTEDSLAGKHQINGEVIFTAVFKDNWSVKTHQKFNADFSSKGNRKTRKK